MPHPSLRSSLEGMRDAQIIAGSNIQPVERLASQPTRRIRYNGRMMRIAPAMIFTAAMLASVFAQGQSSDDDLKVYAVSINRADPFIWPFSGFGVYLGGSLIITAAHVVGHWPLFTNPTITIAGRNVPATIIKKGSFPAQLSVEPASLNVSLRLRQSLLCAGQPDIGTNVVVAYPNQTARSQIISSRAIAPQYRSHFGTLISEPHVSGSGVFDADKKCLVGIMSAAVTRNDFMGAAVTPYRFQSATDDRVGYFVPASAIADFLPAHYSRMKPANTVNKEQ